MILKDRMHSIHSMWFRFSVMCALIHKILNSNMKNDVEWFMCCCNNNGDWSAYWVEAKTTIREMREKNWTNKLIFDSITYHIFMYRFYSFFPAYFLFCSFFFFFGKSLYRFFFLLLGYTGNLKNNSIELKSWPIHQGNVSHRYVNAIVQWLEINLKRKFSCAKRKETKRNGIDWNQFR